MTPNVRLRPATAEDAAELAVLHRRVRTLSLPYLPDLHTPEEDLRFFRDHVLPKNIVWTADVDERPIGYAAFADGWLNQLYIEPAWHGRGIGTALLGKAKEASSTLQLWVFQRNHQARSFYERHGFRLVELTDGSANEEREPDARYEWRTP